MKPLLLTLVALLCSLPAFAQQASKAAEAPKAVPASDGPVLDLWRWFVGPKAGKGAYKAGPLGCGQVHDMTNVAAKDRKSSETFDGHRYGMRWLISIASNNELCLGPKNDGRSIPPEALLPNPPWKSSEWLFADESRRGAATALSSYNDAADKAQPIANFTKHRAAFWKESLKAVLSDDKARGLICQEVDFGPNCSSVIATKSLDELYDAGRKALK